MKIVPEKVFVQGDPKSGEIVAVMDGFRITLSRSESEALRDGLTAGLRQLALLAGEVSAPRLGGAAEGEASSARKLTAIPT